MTKLYGYYYKKSEKSQMQQECTLEAIHPHAT